MSHTHRKHTARYARRTTPAAPRTLDLSRLNFWHTMVTDETILNTVNYAIERDSDEQAREIASNFSLWREINL